MIEVRLFATLRDGRSPILYVDPRTSWTGCDLLNYLEIVETDVAIFLIDGWHKSPKEKLPNPSVIAIFPPVGGG